MRDSEPETSPTSPASTVIDGDTARCGSDISREFAGFLNSVGLGVCPQCTAKENQDDKFHGKSSHGRIMIAMGAVRHNKGGKRCC
jgi:hypothetical protein